MTPNEDPMTKKQTVELHSAQKKPMFWILVLTAAVMVVGSFFRSAEHA